MTETRHTARPAALALALVIAAVLAPPAPAAAQEGARPVFAEVIDRPGREVEALFRNGCWTLYRRGERVLSGLRCLEEQLAEADRAVAEHRKARVRSARPPRLAMPAGMELTIEPRGTFVASFRNGCKVLFNRGQQFRRSTQPCRAEQITAAIRTVKAINAGLRIE